MSTDDSRAHDPWRQYVGPNLGYILERYDQFKRNPDTVEPAYRELFERWGAPPEAASTATHAPNTADANLNETWLHKVIQAGKLVHGIRDYGHLAADMDPVNIGSPARVELLQPETYGLTAADLAALPASWVWHHDAYPLSNGLEAIEKLKDIYTGTLAYDFNHVHVEEERRWLIRQAEIEIPAVKLNNDERIALLDRVIQAEQFEQFLQKTFVGQKRFSAEGVDVLVAMVEETVHELMSGGARHIVMGMAHRGRLNVLAHVLGKPYETIFSEFHHSPNKQLIPSEGSIGINFGWSGDVKYHLGASLFIPSGETVVTRLTLANNPSHLEFVNPVVEGCTRAAQENRSRAGAPVRRMDVAAAILMHGDAAFPGEGIVAETLNFNDLRGYSNGGTVHVIVNNRIGFTTGKRDARSTRYASDLAKGFEIPIVHVNADDPEACIAAARLATGYRNRFNKDFLIDLVGYRRFGHNEADDPETTQPLMYRKIKDHPSVAALYADRLVHEGVLTAHDVEAIKEAKLNRLIEAYEVMKQQERAEPGIQGPPTAAGKPDKPIETAVPLDTLRTMNTNLLAHPAGFRVYPKLQRILERRANAFDEGARIDWAHAETLAFASILADGRPIRLSGQDVERATFAHRNLVLHDYKTGEAYCPLHTLPEARASFAIHNSPLSEAGVLGFEYGYNVYAPETMVIWEAQFGDFANAAQVLIDQFIAAGYAKWKQRSGLTMLLPHGYEGQGPEHSSARLERFLQLSAEKNWVIASLTSAAQYFHLLRRQAALCGTEAARPLVLMAPKSLIRHARAASPASEFSAGRFQPVVEQTALGGRSKQVQRLLLCSGKIAVELMDAIDQIEQPADWLHLASIEQLYPLPEQEIAAVLERLPHLMEICWVQEEPQNMGAWPYMFAHLHRLAPIHAAVRYIGRPEHASPASGFQQVHTFEQETIVKSALMKRPGSEQLTGGEPHV